MLTDLPPEISSGPTGTADARRQGAPARETEAVGEVARDVRAVARELFQWARQQKGVKVIPAVERELVIEALSQTGGNQVQAAKLLGITRATLRKRIDKFKITQELLIE